LIVAPARLEILASAQRQHLRQAAAGVEVFLSEYSRRPAVVLVRINFSGESLFEIAKCQQTFSRRQMIRKPGVFGKNWSAREVWPSENDS
jgi:hypothetical protein